MGIVFVVKDRNYRKFTEKEQNMKLKKVAMVMAAAAMLMSVPAYADEYDTWYARTSQEISDRIEQEYNEAMARGEDWGDMTPQDAYEIAMSDAISAYLNSSTSTNTSTTTKKTTTKTVSGTIKSAYWEGKKAKWSYSGNLKQFSVVLYRNGQPVTTKKITGGTNYVSFANELSKEGEYYFKVRGKESNGWTSYEESSEYVVYKTSANTTAGTTVNSVGPTQQLGTWTQAKDGSGRWWYPHANGAYTTNNWEQINNRWYYFDGSGWMSTGWLNLNGSWYYLGTDGGMVTGFATIDNATHYFADNGIMLY